MYAKLIHSYKIVLADDDCLRHGGKITVHPTHEDYLRAGYYPLVGVEGTPEEGKHRFTLTDDVIVATPRREGKA